MRPTVRIEGFESLNKKLEALASKFSSKRETEIRGEAAEGILAEMKALVPVWSGGLRDSLAIVDDGLSVAIGPIKGGAGSRAHFIEFGTVHMAAQPFIRPAFDNTADSALDGIKSSLRSDVLGAARG